MINKGLVSYIQSDNKKIYKLENSNNLIEFFISKKEEIEKKENIAKEVAKEITKINQLKTFKQDAKIFKGKQAIKTFYNETLNKGDYVVFGAPKNSIEIMGELFWKVYNKRKMEKKIKAKMIFNQELKEFSKQISNKDNSIRFFEKEFEPLTETHIQANYVAIIVWTAEPIIFYIEDNEVAESYRKYFEKLWLSSKK